MKKKIISMLLVAFTAFSLVACGGGQAASAPAGGTADKAEETAPAAGEKADEAAAPAAGAQELTFWTFQAAHQKFMEDAAARWNSRLRLLDMMTFTTTL